MMWLINMKISCVLVFTRQDGQLLKFEISLVIQHTKDRLSYYEAHHYEKLPMQCTEIFSSCKKQKFSAENL